MNIYCYLVTFQCCFIHSGHYMYIETSNPRKPGDMARMISPRYPPTNGRCLKFWYHMYGRSVGTLAIFVRSEQGKEILVDSKTGNFGNQWLLAEYEVSSLSSFQVSWTIVFHFFWSRLNCPFCFSVSLTWMFTT